MRLTYSGLDYPVITAFNSRKSIHRGIVKPHQVYGKYETSQVLSLQGIKNAILLAKKCEHDTGDR